jgi:hypothetical protein
MKALMKVLMILLGVVVIAGCGGKDTAKTDKPNEHKEAQHAETADHDDSDHDHAEEDMDDSGHSDPNSLGTQTIGAYTVEVVAYGGIEAGHEGDIDVDVDGGTPKTVRAWVGQEDGVGSVKALAEEEEPGHYHVHVDVGNEIPEGAKFWLELEEESGEVLAVSFDI